MKEWKNFIGPSFVLLVFFAALYLLHRELSQYHLHDFVAALQAIPANHVLAAVALTVLNYVILTGYDWVGLRYVGHPMPIRRIAIASFLGSAVGNNFGSLLGGSGVRYRLYSNWGLSAAEIVKLVLLLSLTFWISALGISGLVMLVDPVPIPERLHLPFSTARPIGILFSALTVLYLTASVLQKKVRIHQWELVPPPLRLAALQYLIGALDFAVAAAVLYVLLPADLSIGYWHFFGAFLLAIVLSVISTVPGGLGVFELTLIVLLDRSSSQGLVGSLLAFRLIYYLIPLLLGLLLLVGNELTTHQARVKEAIALTRKWSNVVAPRILALSVFLAGIVLLISGATPTAEGRIGLLRRALPLPAIEISHFLGSILGVALLILARGLQRRIETAWYLTIGLLAGGIVVSLLKGFDWEEAIILGVMLLLLLPARSHFYRHGSFLRNPFTPGWFAAIAMVLGFVVWIMFFAYKHVDYREEIWWRFAFNESAPRSLRALVGVGLTMLFFAMMRLASSRGRLADLPTARDVADALQIVRRSPLTIPNLARLGDKRFLFNADRSAFIMYGEEGGSLISMGDPVGTEREARELVWEFRDLCDITGRTPVFYQVDEERVAMYVESGLTLLKIGEEARVSLPNFDLLGKKRADLRSSDRKMTQAGCRFEVIEVSRVPALMPRLKEISDAWLQDKNTGEKGFSLGFFKPDYVATCPVAVVWQNDRIIAFANLWEGAEKQELSIDLMRYLPKSPNGLMDYLIMKLMLWGREQGFGWFNLGMAPLAGIEAKSGSPIWNRFAELTYRHGEHFYNFMGLRAYKEKFAPEWKPKYIACPGGIRLPRVLTNVTTLISGGIGKLIRP
jgi:phosphatidylglycerol lysyltransferase